MSQKILIVSDSHGDNTNLRKAIDNLGDYMDMMIHLGDMECDPDEIREMVKCPVEMVRGNCDYSSKLQGTKLVDIGEHRAMITHGHRYGGLSGVAGMCEMAQANDADIVMFGHIHEPLVEEYGDVTVVNPGSISRPRQAGRRPSYMVMNIEDNGRVDFVPVYL